MRLSLNALPILLSLAAAGLLLAGLRQSDDGATFAVNSQADATDAIPGDGQCETAPGNNICTLRAAIQESNALFGTDMIVLPAGFYPLTIAGPDEDASATGDLDINDDLILVGAGAAVTIVDGGQLDRVFDVLSGTVQLSAVTIQNGILATTATLLAGGGLRNGGTLILAGSAVLSNSVGSVPPNVGYGGGLFNTSLLTVTGSYIAGNMAGRGGGVTNEGAAWLFETVLEGNAAETGGGGLANLGLMILSGAVISANHVPFDYGGGLYLAGNSVTTINRSTLAYNFGGAGGGGLAGFSSSEPISLTLANSAVYHNSTLPVGTTGGSGGGLYLGVGASATIVNATFSHNSSYVGGAILKSGAESTVILNSTMAHNNAEIVGGLFYGDGVLLKNTILAHNEQANCGGGGTPESAGNNLESDDSCYFLVGPGDLINTDPELGPLQDNGGPTWTHALLDESPAIDAADNSGCPPTDQRGAPRPVDGDGDGSAICDIGAYEYSSAAPTPTPTPNPSATPAPTAIPTATITPAPPGVRLLLPAIMSAE